MGMSDHAFQPRWYRFTPDRLVIGLLILECLLWLSERLDWPLWHKAYAVLTAVAIVGVTVLVMLLWFVASLIFRWRFQFNIRSLLVMAMVVAILCSWMTVEMRAAKRQQEAIEAILSDGGIEVAYEGDSGGVLTQDWSLNVRRLSVTPPPPPPLQSWVETLLGKDFVRRAVAVGLPLERVGDAVPQLARLPYVWRVGILAPDNRHNDECDAAIKRIKQEMPGVEVFGIELDFDIQAGEPNGEITR